MTEGTVTDRTAASAPRPAARSPHAAPGEAPNPAPGPRRDRPLPSVRLLITLIVVIPIFVVSVALIVITTLTSRAIAEQLGAEIVSSATAQVSDDVSGYLGSAMRVSDLYVRRLRDGALDPHDLPKWERPMFDDLAVNPHVASICFSTPDGDCTWLLHAHNRLELGIVRGDARDRAVEYPADADGNVDRNNPIRIYRYDATARPWFQTALTAAAPVWTPIYFWFGEQGSASETGSGYTRTIRDASGELLGVLVIDVTLGALSANLKQLQITRSGYAFIVDEQGLLVAASDGPVNSVDGKRLLPADSSSAAARAIAGFVAPHESEALPPRESARPTRRVEINGAPARVQVTPLEPYPGIRWRAVTVLPESSFLTTATSMQRRAIILAIGAICAGLAVGLFLSRRISDPLVQLSSHVAKVGAGEFDRRLSLGHASELRRLSDEVNRMAGGLKQRMQLEQSLAVAEQVQQSLLPLDVPRAAGLQIAACCKYCDSTGGDYYDFIDLDPPNVGSTESGRTLIVVGDVTGHGIGAALLMATSRGAVRSSARSAKSLGEILTHSNRVLCASERNGTFMTMFLLLIDPAHEEIRWASAGHDPAIVYHADSDSFDELQAHNLPLGVEEVERFDEGSRTGVSPGMIVVVGTDGIWEARNRAGEMFGKNRLRELMRRHHASADELSSAIKQAMQSFVGDAPLTDDVTFVIARVV